MRFGALFEPKLAHENAAPLILGRRQQWVGRQGAVQRRQRLLQPVERLQLSSLVERMLGGLRIERAGDLELLQRLLVSARFRERLAELAVCVRIIGLEGNGLLQLGQSRIHLAERPIGAAERPMKIRIVGRIAQCPLRRDQRLVGTPQEPIDDAQLVVGSGMLLVQPDGALQRFDCLLELVQAPLCRAEQIVKVGDPFV